MFFQYSVEQICDDIIGLDIRSVVIRLPIFI